MTGVRVCALTSRARTGSAVNSSSVLATTAAGGSASSSTASLNSGGVASTRPAASVRYRGTGSVTAIRAPACAAFTASTRPMRPSTRASNAVAFAVNCAAPTGSAAPRSAAICAASFFTVGRLYQTCSLRSPPAGAASPDSATTSITAAPWPGVSRSANSS